MITTQRPRIGLDGSWDFIPDPGSRLAPETLPTGSPTPVPGPWEAALDEPDGIVHASAQARSTADVLASWASRRPVTGPSADRSDRPGHDLAFGPVSGLVSSRGQRGGID